MGKILEFRVHGGAALVAAAILALGTWLGGPSGAVAQEAAAMVEDMTPERDDLLILDFLYPGDTVALGGGEMITIGYFASCAQEKITGGTVTVGQFASTVDGGSVETAYIDCDDQVVALADDQRQEVGTAVFRPGDPCDSLVPDLVIYDPSPLARIGADATNVVYVGACEAGAGAWKTVSPTDGRGMVDFRAAGVALTPGQTYLLRAGDTTLTVLVSKLASPDSPSMLSRLVPLAGGAGG